MHKTSTSALELLTRTGAQVSTSILRPVGADALVLHLFRDDDWTPFSIQLLVPDGTHGRESTVIVSADSISGRSTSGPSRPNLACKRTLVMIIV